MAVGTMRMALMTVRSGGNGRRVGTVMRRGGRKRMTVGTMRGFRTRRMVAVAMRFIGCVRMAGRIMRGMGEVRMIGERCGVFRRQVEMQGGDAARLDRNEPGRTAARGQNRHDVGQDPRPQVRQGVQQGGDEHVARRSAHRVEVDMLRAAAHQACSGQGSVRLPAASKPMGLGSWTTSIPGRSRTDGSNGSET